MAYLPASRVKWLTQHYTATVIGGPPVTMEVIDRWHRERGMRKAGYHYLIRLGGAIETGREVLDDGRFEQGAHSRGENDESIGIVCEGGLVEGSPRGQDTRTPAQVVAQIGLIRRLLKLYPQAKVEGHRDMPGAATECPGYDAAAWWASVRDVPDAGSVEAPPGPMAPNLAAVTAERDRLRGENDRLGDLNSALTAERDFMRWRLREILKAADRGLRGPD